MKQNDCRVRARTYGLPMAETEIIFSIQESLGSGFEAKALSHSIYTEAETLRELKKKVQDAVRCHFDEKDRPSLIRLHLVKGN
jgi:hypothetical protein